MKYLLVGLCIGGLVAILITIASDERLNARCYKTNMGYTTICHYSDGRVEIYREEVK
jgi:hypothetical protein